MDVFNGLPYLAFNVTLRLKAVEKILDQGEVRRLCSGALWKSPTAKSKIMTFSAAVVHTRRYYGHLRYDDGIRYSSNNALSFNILLKISCLLSACMFFSYF